MNFSRRQALALLGATALPPGMARAGPNDPTLEPLGGRTGPLRGIKLGARPDGGFMLASGGIFEIGYVNYSATGLLQDSKTLSFPYGFISVAQPVILPDGVTMVSFCGEPYAPPGNPGVFTVQISKTGQAITPVTRISVATSEKPSQPLAIKRSDRTSLVAWQTEAADRLTNVRWRIVGRNAITTGVQTVKRPFGRASHTLVGLRERPNLAAALLFDRAGPSKQSYLQLIAPSGEAEGAQIALGETYSSFAVAPDGRIAVLRAEWDETSSAFCVRFVGRDGALSPVVRSVVDDAKINTCQIAVSSKGYFVVTSTSKGLAPEGYTEHHQRAHLLDFSGNLIQTRQVALIPDRREVYFSGWTPSVTRLLTGDFIGIYEIGGQYHFQRMRLGRRPDQQP